MWKEFKAFALRGNVVDLAVAVILGIAFGALITSLVQDVIMNLIAALVGRPDFDDLTFNVGDGVIRYGSFLNAVVNFLLIALALFLIVRMVSRAMRPKGAEPEAPVLRECPYCLSSIPERATKCSFCASEILPIPAEGAAS
jgi:large conductance mechanosensitive channel